MAEDDKMFILGIIGIVAMLFIAGNLMLDSEAMRPWLSLMDVKIMLGSFAVTLGMAILLVIGIIILWKYAEI